MTTEEMVTNLQDIFTKALERVGPESVGELQYSRGGDLQKFETMSAEELFTEIEQEILDLINYAGMAFLRVGSIRAILHTQVAILDPETGVVKLAPRNSVPRVDFETTEEYKEWLAKLP